jgi:hypothetical protein
LAGFVSLVLAGEGKNEGELQLGRRRAESDWFWFRKIKPGRGAAVWLDRFRVRLFPFFLYFSFKITPFVCVVETTIYR